MKISSFFWALLGDKELIQEVLFDAVVTAPLEAYWTSLVLNKSEYVTPLFPCSFSKMSKSCSIFYKTPNIFFFFNRVLIVLNANITVKVGTCIYLSRYTGTLIKVWR